MWKWIKAHAPKVRAAARVPIGERLTPLSDYFELSGLTCFAAGAFMINTVAGVFTLGTLLYYLGWVTHESR